MAECKWKRDKQREECNVLLCGPTGVGKSTFINALCNYLSYQSLDEAKKSKTKVAIPYEFTLADKDMKKTIIRFGTDSKELIANEVQSSAKNCKDYCFGSETFILRIIDSPGMLQNQTEVENMLTFVSKYGELHAICIVLKPNESKLAKPFKRFVKVLLGRSQTSTSARIVFVFTNSRSSSYSPGDTLDPLTALLDKIKHKPPKLDIPFNENNVFFLENESFCFLVALEKNYGFDPSYHQVCQLSWNKSRQECHRLLQYILCGLYNENLTIYNVPDSISNSNEGKPAMTMPEQPADIIRNIQDSPRKLDESKKQKDMMRREYEAPTVSIPKVTGTTKYPSVKEVISRMNSFNSSQVKKPTYFSNRRPTVQIRNQPAHNSIVLGKEFVKLPNSRATHENVKEGPQILNEKMSRRSSSGMSLFNPIRSQRFKAIPGNEYNVLLMGPTGVGKSTFINSFANYLNFETLDEAEKNNPKSLIACKFSVSDENYIKQTVHFGSDPNEDLDTKGQSATQSCKAYEFPLDGFTLRIIDTPGIGDTRGIDQDRKNIDGILSFLSDYDDLYAICILLKPNDSRLTPLFSFCIKQLLCHLHANASNNIVFIFTNSRNTFYRPGDTTTPLETLLEQIKCTPPYPQIPFGKDNIFCLDNEAFRFLVALQNGIKFSNNDRVNFGQSWAKSVEESERMIRYIVEGSNGQGLTPHNVYDTLGVNQARDAILDLAKPLSELSKNIQNNLQVLTEHKKDLEDCKDNEDKLKTMLYMPVVTLDIKELDQPRTVCTGADCREPHQIGNQVQYHYPVKCHDPCTLEEVPRDIVGAAGLRHCAAINSVTAKCHKCSCHYSVHLHIYYESQVVDSKVIDENIEKQLETKAGVKQAAEDMVTKLEAEITKYKAEEKILTDSIATLAVFLKHNAMVVCNDAFKEYLNEIIENEKSLSECGSKNAEVIIGLNKMLANYEIEKDILEKALNNPTSQHDHISTADVDKIINDISNMKISGVIFKRTTQALNKAKERRSKR